MLKEEQIEHLRKLKELLDSGILSEEEFAREKAKVFSGSEYSGTSYSSRTEDKRADSVYTKPASSEKKKKKSKTVWIVLGCLAGLLVLITLLGNLFSDGSYDSYNRYEEIDTFIATLGYNSEMDIQRIGDTVYSNYTGETDSSTELVLGFLSGLQYGNSSYNETAYQSARQGFITAGKKNPTKTAFYQCMARNQINYVYQIHGRDVFSYSWDELYRLYTPNAY